MEKPYGFHRGEGDFHEKETKKGQMSVHEMFAPKFDPVLGQAWGVEGFGPKKCGHISGAVPIYIYIYYVCICML